LALICSAVSGGRVVAPRRVADHRREVADQEDHLMPQVLQLAHLVQHDGVADVDVGRRRVQAELDPQGRPLRFGARELARPFVFGQQFLSAAPGDRQRLADTIRYRITCNRALIHKDFSEGRADELDILGQIRGKGRL
jgi:hypothetical protein